MLIVPESGFFGVLYRISDVIYKLAWSNLLWFFTAGFPVIFLFTPYLLEGAWVVPVGLFLLIGPPGTAALFHVMREWIENDDVSVWSDYWRGWKKHWKRAYKVIDLYVLVGVILVVDLVVVASTQDSVVRWIGFLLLPTLTLYVLTTVTLIPLTVRFEWKLLELLRNAFIMSVSHLFSSIAVLITVGGLLFIITSTVPVLTFFCFASVPAWAFTWQTHRIVEKIRRMSEEQEDDDDQGGSDAAIDVSHSSGNDAKSQNSPARKGEQLTSP